MDSRKAVTRGELFVLPLQLINLKGISMGLFKKSIDRNRADEFFKLAYTKTISAEASLAQIDKLSQLKEVLPILANVNQTTFNTNLNAINLTLLDFAWSQYLKAKHINISDIIDSGVHNEGIREQVVGMGFYNNLLSSFNQAVGRSSFSRDASGELAFDFVNQILASNDLEKAELDDLNELRKTISWLFLGSYDLYTKNFQEFKLIV